MFHFINHFAINLINVSNKKSVSFDLIIFILAIFGSWQIYRTTFLTQQN